MTDNGLNRRPIGIRLGTSMTEQKRDEKPADRYIVAGLGASAGGLEPLEQFFKHMPADAGIAFVVVVHLAPDHKSSLPELLARCTSMPVESARDGVRVEPNRVYVIPPNAVLTIQDCTIRLAQPTAPRGQRMPIDSLFASLAEDLNEEAVCILLSGTGTDGTLGLEQIKENGGMAMAQNLESARYDAILRSAISTGLVDHVLPVEEMPAKLAEYAAHLKSLDGKPNHVQEQILKQESKIYDLLRRRIGHDFSGYKNSTIGRRIERRMKALQIESVNQYVQTLESQPEEIDRLFKDLLIGVTGFFRDPEAFEALRREVIPRLFEGKDARGEVRVCVVGCATGEEAYSIAILLREYALTLDHPITIKVFATEINGRGLEIAREGRYSAAIAEQVSAERLERFFTKEDHSYCVKREIRDLCIFSIHNFLNDPPFSRQDLISCRNVMIYFGQELQRKVIPLFHYALRPGGYLFLGSSESVASQGGLFETVDKKHRIFQRKEAGHGAPVFFPLAETGRARHMSVLPESEKATLPKRLERVILRRYARACVIVQENGTAVYFSGPISRYLEHTAGTPEKDVVNMAREGLRIPLRTTLHRAVSTRERAVQPQIPIQTDGSGRLVDLTVEPLQEFANLYIVVIEEVSDGGGGWHAPRPAATLGCQRRGDHRTS
jgi:two-component system, chemotaxis family, CheB/CheR fusion protein